MLSLSSVSAAAQSFRTAPHAPARNMVWTEKMESHISFLSDTLCHGRGTGTQGGAEAAFWIARQFRDVGLIPLDRSWSQSFKTANGTTGHNIIGMVPGSLKKPSDKYIIIAAHYDHLGVLNGKAYPGADANASGTAAVVLLAEMFTAMKSVGSTFGTNIIFAGLDRPGHRPQDNQRQDHAYGQYRPDRQFALPHHQRKRRLYINAWQSDT